jgi:hypothetical protein
MGIMTKITEQEANNLISDYSNYGIRSWMGGVNTDAYNQIYMVSNDYYIFTQDEIACHTLEYQKIVKMQEQECRNFLNERN